MPRRQPSTPSLVTTPAANRGLFGLAMRLKGLIRTNPARPAVPDDLLADVLADNGLRAREEERRKPQISGPWR